MSVIWVLLVAATGASPADSGNSTAANSAASPPPAAASTAEPAARSANELRHAVADALRRAVAARAADRDFITTRLIDLFNELGKDRQLTPLDRQRLGVEIRARLARFAAQFRHELARNSQPTSSESEAGAAGGPAAKELDDLVDLIQKTIGPQDWVLAQRIGGPGGAGQPGAGLGGQGGGASGGAIGGSLEQQANANGQALVDLIQTTIAPNTWDVRGGPGTIAYFNPLRALVVRQTGDAHGNLSDLLGGLRR